MSHIRCEIPPEVREYVRVTSWLHEEGTAIEIFPEKVKNFLTTDKQLFDQMLFVINYIKDVLSGLRKEYIAILGA